MTARKEWTDAERLKPMKRIGRPRAVVPAVVPAPGSGVVAVGLSSIPQKHGGALLAGGVLVHKGANQHTVRERAQAVRGELVAELEGAAKGPCTDCAPDCLVSHPKVGHRHEAVELRKGPAARSPPARAGKVVRWIRQEDS